MIVLYNEVYVPVKGKNIVLVGGCFDVLHYGHLTFLKQAKALGNHLLVALESDDTLVNTKNRNVFHTQSQRAEILESLSFVDEVLTLPTMSSDQAYFKLVNLIAPKVIALTQGDSQIANKKKQAKDSGASCVSIPFEQGFSTTDLLEKYRGNLRF